MTEQQKTKVVDLSTARNEKNLQRKEQQVEAIRARFSRALGIDEKPTAKLKKAWRKNKKSKK